MFLEFNAKPSLFDVSVTNVCSLQRLQTPICHFYRDSNKFHTHYDTSNRTEIHVADDILTLFIII